jgi:phosphoglycerate kinase
MKTIDDFSFKNKTALIRVDFNVPLNEAGEVTDGTRIAAARSSIIKVLEDGGRCVLMSHLGRPKDKEPEFSLGQVVEKASDILGVNVRFANDCIGEGVREKVQSLENGEILLLENLRYYPEEKAGDKAFAEKLAEWGDVYVNDAFGTAHRAHASTAVIAEFFPENKCAGHLLAREIENLNKVLTDSQSPVTAIIGGAKVSSKITIIENILDRIDNLIIGGGMAFTFIKAKGGEIGDSLVEEDKQDLALEILEAASKKGVSVHLPTDTLTADRFSADANTEVQPIDAISNGRMGLDAGPDTIGHFRQVILDSNTILWNGPVGVFEMPPFANGTIAVGQAIADATASGAFSLVGGGDSVAAAKQFGFTDQVSYVSTGGGAMLEMLEGKTLPGIEALG